MRSWAGPLPRTGPSAGAGVPGAAYTRGMAEPGTVEVERKYDVDPSAAAPPLARMPGVVRIGPAVEHRLEAVYFDTGELSLVARGMTLRRRTGGTDAGWHLKLPQGLNRRAEITEPLGPGGEEVPERLRQLVRAHVRDRLLVPVARVSTRRSTIALLGEGDAVLAEFSDDRVESQSLIGGGAPLGWREWELELVDGTEDLLDAADVLLCAHGARASVHPSKLARALGETYPRSEAPAPQLRRKGPASAVLLAYLHEQTEALKAMDRGVREDEPDAVHQLRVSARRMRSALATYRKLADRDAAAHLREELQWAAGAVGAARDVEVMRQRLRDMVAAEPADLLMGPVAQGIEEELEARYRDARESGLAALESERYFRLLDALDAFLDDPPLTDAAHRKGGKTAARLVASDLDRLRDAVRAAREAEGGDTADAALHEVRKCAKRLRYAAESAAPVLGKRSRRLAKDAARIQQILGDHQDSVVTRDLLRELAAQAFHEGINAFSFGRLHAQEQHRGTEARMQFFREWTRFKPKPLPGQ